MDLPASFSSLSAPRPSWAKTLPAPATAAIAASKEALAVTLTAEHTEKLHELSQQLGAVDPNQDPELYESRRTALEEEHRQLESTLQPFDPSHLPPPDELSEITWAGAHHTLLLLDCSSSMFYPVQISTPGSPTTLTSPFILGLSILSTLLRSLSHITATLPTSTRRDTVICMLYNTRAMSHDPDSSAKTTTKILKPIGAPAAEDILKIDERIRREKEVLAKEYVIVEGVIAERSGEKMKGGDGFKRAESHFKEMASMEELPENEQETFKRITGSTASLSPLRMGLYAAHRNLDPLVSPEIRKGSKTTPPDTKSIWIITNNTTPTRDDEEKQRLVQICADGVERGIDVEVWGLPQTSTLPFTNEAFYHRIISADTPETAELFTFVPASTLTESTIKTLQYNEAALQSRVRLKQKKKRRIAAIPLILPHNSVPIHCDMYRLTQPVKRPGSILVNATNNLPLRREVQLLSVETGDIVEKTMAPSVHRSSNTESRMDSPQDPNSSHSPSSSSGLTTYIGLGNDRVPFAKSDIDQIKKLASKNLPPGLRVLGFKRMETLKIHERVDRSYFIYPDPTRADTGGRPALVALHAACLKKNLFALCELIIRVDTIPRMCALIPQLQETNGCGEQVKSDGFCLSILPFEDDFRLVVAADGAADGEQVDAAQALITKLQLTEVEWGYSFSNPALKRFWSYLETVAINYPAQDFDELGDETVIPGEGVMRRAGEQLKAFCDVLPVDPPPEPKKRKAAVVKGGGKKVKVEKREGSSDEEEEEIDWVVAWEAGVLKSYTVAKLKMFCEENGLKKGGNKGELVDRIDDHISEARGVME